MNYVFGATGIFVESIVENWAIEQIVGMNTWKGRQLSGKQAIREYFL